MKTVLLKIEGMKCDSCENRIVYALQQIKGISNITANHQKGTVEVTIDKTIDSNLIKEKISNLGFTVIGEII